MGTGLGMRFLRQNIMTSLGKFVGIQMTCHESFVTCYAEGSEMDESALWEK